MKRYLFLCLAALAIMMSATSCRTSSKVAKSAPDQKHEFRGAWIQTAFQDRYMNKTPQRCREYLASLIEMLEQTGFNAVIFQVRPEGDAFYPSQYEPWSRFLTGRQGTAPSPQWDPMQYLIELCHSHGMEFHAWINPYRSAASKTWNLASSNIYYQHPEWFVTYDGKLYLNPGLPESRSWIRNVVKDIVSRYDIDALHMDDYFYPYPAGSEDFNDHYAFATYGPVMGFDINNPLHLGDFRRRNVNILIKAVHDDIRAIKPWVRFGISPFGIYRNRGSWEGGSNTNGTQCYDNLYADVLLWAEEGWIDYVIPQLYWEIGHKTADYKTLCDWWAKSISPKCQLYIGQSIERSLDELPSGDKINDLTQSSNHFISKLNQSRSHKRILGNSFWYAYEVEDNTFHVRDFLKRSVFQTPAMPPAYTHLNSKAPAKASHLDGELVRTDRGRALHLFWTAPKTDRQPNHRTRYYNIYRFAKGESVNTRSLKHLYAHSAKPEFYDYNIDSSSKYTYVITAVDYYNNEGKPIRQSFTLR